MQTLFLHLFALNNLDEIKSSGLSYLFCQMGTVQGFICGEVHIIEELQYAHHFVVYLESVENTSVNLNNKHIYTLCHACILDLPLDDFKYNVWRV